ncbi:unnamed protein product [Cochlearia groenlandica]
MIGIRTRSQCVHVRTTTDRSEMEFGTVTRNNDEMRIFAIVDEAIPHRHDHSIRLRLVSNIVSVGDDSSKTMHDLLVKTLMNFHGISFAHERFEPNVPDVP